MTMTFSQALDGLVSGRYSHIERHGWNGEGLQVKLQKSDEQNTRPYLYLVYPDANRVPWVPSQSDMLMDDWRGTLANTNSNAPAALAEATD